MLKYFTYKIIFLLLAIPLGILSWYSPYGWFFITGFILLFATGQFLGSINVCSGFYLDVFCKGNPASNSISLSFDDGPHPEQTPIILDILKRQNIKAVFFCIGNNAKNYPELVKRIENEGHIIGNHSFLHSFWFDLLSKKKMKEEIVNTNLLIQDLINKKMNFFRPPFGVTTPVLARAIKETKMVPVGWSLRTLDTTAKGNPEKIVRKLNKVKSGDLILFHDHVKELPEVLDSFISKMKNQNMQIVRPDELLNLKAYE